MSTAYREIQQGLRFAEVLGLAAAAGTAAIFIRHENGPTPILKSKMAVGLVALGGAMVAAMALSKSMNDHTKKGDRFSVIGALAGAICVSGLYVLTQRAKESRTLTSGGPDVFKAQLGLLRLGYPVPTSGQLDQATHEALKRFQATYSLLTQDGSLSPETAAYIEQAVRSLSQPPPFSPDAGYHPASITQV